MIYVAMNKRGWRVIFVTLIVVYVGILTGCFDLDWKITLSQDGSGVAELKFINISLPTTNFKADLERASDWIQKLYRIGATSEVGTESGREYVLYHVNFEHISDLNGDNLRFAYKVIDNGGSYEFSLTPIVRNPLTPRIGFHLEVKMPGEITVSNASTIVDNVAIWDGTLNEFSRRGALYARSKVPILSSFTMIGLGIFLLVTFMAGTWMLVAKRRSIHSDPYGNNH